MAVEALELVPLMTDRAKVTHEVWTISDSDTIQLEYTFADVDASDNTTLSTRFSSVRTIKVLQVRTIRSGVNVEWREVRLFQPLPPAFGSWTATPTLTPTFGATPTGTPTPLAQATLRAVSASASSEQLPNNPAPAAIDGNPASFWRPAANPSNPYLQVNLDGAQTVAGVRFTTAMGDAIATATATVGPSTPTATPFGASYRVNLVRPSLAAAASEAGPRTIGGVVRSALGLATPTAGPSRSAQDNDCFSQFVAGDNLVVQGACGPYSGVTAIRIFVEGIGNPALPPGVREVTVYPPASGTETPTPTLTATPTQPSGTSTPTRTPTATPIA